MKLFSPVITVLASSLQGEAGTGDQLFQKMVSPAGRDFYFCVV